MQPHMVDYHPVQLIEVPPGMTLEQVMRERGVYAAHDAHARAMREEGEEEDARRWAHVEPELRQRRADLPGWRV